MKRTVTLSHHPWTEHYNPSALLQVSGFYWPHEPPSGFDETGKPTYPGFEEDFEVAAVSIQLPDGARPVEVEITHLLCDEALCALREDVLDFIHSTQEAQQ